MRCAEVRENLVAYLDGELPPEERDRIESHLGGCDACRRERTALDTTGDLLSLLGSREQSETDLAARVISTAKEGDPWCRHIRREIVAYVDGELDDTEARPVREHLEECEDCTREASSLRRTAEALAAWKTPELGTDLVAKVLGPRPSGRGRVFRLAAAAVAACVLVVAGIFALRSGESPVPDTATTLMNLLEEDPDLLEMAEDLDWLESVSEDELALLNGMGG
ncbi:MAG: anti-sigma factor family protein [Planctomycetota bacterium]|jgi:anti-sigma factor RsiW